MNTFSTIFLVACNVLLLVAFFALLSIHISRQRSSLPSHSTTRAATSTAHTHEDAEQDVRVGSVETSREGEARNPDTQDEREWFEQRNRFAKRGERARRWEEG
jgi:hypothetical protein